jgi:4-amino-4-deoxy-L-arabinose transferase-like glycosyltransferase
MIRDWLRTPDARWALAILALALVIRLVTVAAIHPSPRDGRFDDSVWYDTSARHLAAGDGYVFDPTVWVTANGSPIYPDEDALTPSALWPPAYSATLAASYLVSGDSLWAGRMLNVVCGALTAVLVFAIAHRLFGLVQAAVAGLAMAIYPGHVLFTPLIMSETFFLFLMTATLASFLYFVIGPERPRILAAAGVGLLAGITAMARGEFLLFSGVLALLAILRFGVQRPQPAVALLLGVTAIFAPWTARNAIQMGEPIVGTTGAGRVALQGHNARSEGIPSLEVVGRLEADFAAFPRKEREIETNREGSRRAREYALDHPLDELRLIPRRMFGLFRSDEAAIAWTQSNKPWFGPNNADRLIRISSAFFFASIALTLIGWPLWWRTRDPARLLVFAPVPFYMVVFGVLFIGDPRYHFAMYPTLVIFAAPAIVALLGATRDGWRDVAGGRPIGTVLHRYGTPAAPADRPR